jgi:hypothetical protein
MSEAKPARFVKVLDHLVPGEHKVEHSNSLKNLTDEQLDAMIEAIQEMLTAKNAKVIEGVAEHVGAGASRA